MKTSYKTILTAVSLCLVVLLGVIPIATAYAQNATSTNQIEFRARINSLKADAEQRRNDAQERFEQKREEIKNRVQETMEHARERIWHGIDMSVHQIIRRLLAAIERAEALAYRIDTRIEKLKGDGLDTSEAEGYLSTAREEIEEALILVEQIKTAIEERPDADNIREVFTEIKGLVGEAKEKIHDIYQHLRDAIKSLKTILKIDLDTDTATSSEEN